MAETTTNKQNKNKNKKKSRLSLSEEEVNALSEGHHTCIICFSNLDENIRAKLPCNHDDMCGVCHMRLRFLNEDKKCPICKTTNDTIIVDRDANKKFEEYPRWGDEIGAGFIYRKDVGMFFEETYFHESIEPLFALSCHKCDFKIDENTTKNNTGGKKKNKPRRLLEDHLRTDHRQSMCHLCIDHKRDFISQLPRFTPGQLQKHLKFGDGPGTGFNGHPICEFCHPKRFYDINFLHTHLHKEHYKCHICEKQGQDNQWFKNYKSMSRHFDKQHFMCHDVQCLEARFVVFENELDLRAHELSVHGGSSNGSTKINLEFNIRRANGMGGGGERHDTPRESDFNYSLDGQAFVPQALPNNNDNNNNTNSANNGNNATVPASQLHPQHIQRTEELRAHAAVVRQQQAIESQVESFPTLQSAAASSSSSSSTPLLGWTAGTVLQDAARSNKNIGRVTQDSFPALQSGSSNNGKKKAAMGSIGATRRQFAAMTTSANQRQQQDSWGGNTAIGSMEPSSTTSTGGYFASTPSAAVLHQTNRQSNLASDNFPSLGGPSSGNNNSSADTYSAANSLSKKNFQRRIVGSVPPPSMSSTADFPSMQSSSRSTATASSAKATKKNPPKPSQAPSMYSVSDFPAPPAANRSTRPDIRQHMMGGDSTNNISTQQVRDNVLHADISSATSAKATVEDMKASLGPKNFKQLKRLTKNFAQEQLSPEGYVDQAAALFDRGYGDPDFWSFLPSLLLSCPNQDSSKHALKYMNSLKRQQYHSSDQAPRSASAVAGATSTASWNGASGNKSNVMRQVVPPPLPASYTADRPLTQPVIAAGRSNTFASKNKIAWGSNGKPLASTLSAVVAAQGPQGGSATKCMAKHQKKQKQQQSNNSSQQQSNAENSTTKKKKQKNELKDLAYGR